MRNQLPAGTHRCLLRERMLAAAFLIAGVGLAAADPWAIVATMPVESSPRGIVVLPDGSKAYVANQGSGSVSVLDTATLATRGSVAVGAGPHDPALSPDARRLYVLNLFSSSISVIDTATDAVTSTIVVGGYPAAVAFSSDGTRVLAFSLSAGGASVVSVIDVGTSSVIAAIPVPPAALFSGFALSPDGRRAYVTSAQSATTQDLVSILDLTTYTATAQTMVGDDPIDLALTSDGGRVVVANYTGGTAAVLDGFSGALLGVFPGLYQPFRVRTFGNLACVLRGDDAVDVFDASVPSRVGALSSAPGLNPTAPRSDLARRAADGLGLLTAGKTGEVHAFDLQPASAGFGTRLWSLTTGGTPSDVVFSPDGARAYVVLATLQAVAVLGTTAPPPPPPPPPQPVTLMSAVRDAVAFVRSRLAGGGLTDKQVTEYNKALNNLGNIPSPYNNGGKLSASRLEPALAQTAQAVRNFQKLAALGEDTSGIQSLIALGASNDTKTFVQSMESSLGANNASVQAAWAYFQQGEQARAAGDYRTAVQRYKDAVHVFN